MEFGIIETSNQWTHLLEQRIEQLCFSFLFSNNSFLLHFAEVLAYDQMEKEN